MSELVRWSLKVSRDTDVALRTLLATRSGRKGDLSRLRQPARDVRARNADLDEAEVLRLIEDDLGALRSEVGSHARPLA